MPLDDLWEINGGPVVERGQVACPLCGAAIHGCSGRTSGRTFSVRHRCRNALLKHLTHCESTLSPRERSMLADLAAEHLLPFLKENP